MKRSSESAFLDLYNMVREAPDPHHTFRSILDDEERYIRSSHLRQENDKLRDQLQEYKEEFTQLKNQEVTIKDLEHKIATYQRQMEHEVEQKQQQIGREQEEMLENLQQRSQLLQQQLRQAQEEAGKMRELYEKAQNELFNLNSDQEEQQAAQQSQIELLSDELSNLASKVDVLEEEKRMLLEQLRKGSGALGDDGDGEYVCDDYSHFIRCGALTHSFAEEKIRTLTKLEMRCL